MAADVDLTTLVDEANATEQRPGLLAGWEEHLASLTEEFRKSRRRFNVAIMTVLVATVLVAGLGAKAGSGETLAQPYGNASACLAILAVFIWVFRSDRSAQYRQRINTSRKVVEVLEEERGHDDVAEESVDLDSLLRNNRSLLRSYHSISTDQAQEAFKMAKTVIAVAAVVFLLACVLALRGETVIGISLAGAAVASSGVGGWVARTFLETYRISVTQAEAYFREPMVQGYLLAAHQIAQTMETPQARDEGLSRVMDGFLAAGLECARSKGHPQQ